MSPEATAITPVVLDDLVTWCDSLLDAHSGKDYGPNGLQVRGAGEISHLAVAVSANQAVFDKVLQVGADAILAHHGILWSHQDRRLTGTLGERVRFLMRHDISLLAYHLPLDRHLQVGNAAGLARRMDLEIRGPFGDYHGMALGVTADAPSISGADLEQRLRAVVGDPITAYLAGPEKIGTVALLTGGAQGYLEEAIDAGCDAFVTGEVTEWTRAIAREAGMHFLAGGHYRTERYGIQDLGARIERTFGLKVTFVDHPNPI
jgi:dinuclear metal center YbgI/SA1388 family protein